MDTIFTNKTSLKQFNAKDQELFNNEDENFDRVEFGEKIRNVMLTLKGANMASNSARQFIEGAWRQFHFEAKSTLPTTPSIAIPMPPLH